MNEPTIELAMIRFAVVSKRWDESSAGNFPYIQAFLAGWCCCVCGVGYPEVGQYRDSFRAGWIEAQQAIAIYEREKR